MTWVHKKYHSVLLLRYYLYTDSVCYRFVFCLPVEGFRRAVLRSGRGRRFARDSISPLHYCIIVKIGTFNAYFLIIVSLFPPVVVGALLTSLMVTRTQWARIRRAYCRLRKKKTTRKEK